MVTFIYIVCIWSTEKHSSFQSDNNVAALFSGNAWPIWSVVHFPTLERGLSPMTAQTSSDGDWHADSALGLWGGAVGTAANGAGQVLLEGTEPLCATCCHMECSPRLPDFQRDLKKSLDFNMSQFKTQNGAGQTELSCRATYGQMLQLVASGLHNK